jgi:predicted protein tyrosine phosphatase
MKPMPTLHVCSLARLAETVTVTGASHMVTLINADTPVPRPTRIAPERHLFIGIHDITTPLDGAILPGEEHVAALIDFVQRWDRAKPLVIHCYAGISRSTAAAYISACALFPNAGEMRLAQRLRAASPTATPNGRLIETADALLGRGGRMRAAIAAIGMGALAYEGEPFHLPFD